jgi:Holliday junction resolvase RusA-like endonuclease
LTVHGAACPAGSKRAFLVGRKGVPKRIVVADAAKRSRPWKSLVSQVAGDAMMGRPLLEGPLSLRLRFVVRRPKGHYGGKGQLNAKGRRTPRPSARPDLLKLARAIEDALTGIAYRDDAQIVDEVLTKEYGSPERVEICVGPCCRCCGRSDVAGTSEPCGWAERDLCSACAGGCHPGRFGDVSYPVASGGQLAQPHRP